MTHEPRRVRLTASAAAAMLVGAALFGAGVAAPAVAAPLGPPEPIADAPAGANRPIVFDGALYIDGQGDTLHRSTDGVTWDEVPGVPTGVVDLEVLDDVLYLRTVQTIYGYTTAAGFAPVATIQSSSELFAFEGKLYFAGNLPADNSILLYTYTPGGGLSSIPAQGADYFPHDFIADGDAFYVLFFEGGNTETLYRYSASNGLVEIALPAPPASGNRVLVDFEIYDGSYYFTVTDFVGVTFHRYTPGGVVEPVTGDWTAPRYLDQYAGVLYVTDDNDNFVPTALYRYTVAGGSVLVDGAPSFPDEFTEFDGRAYLSAFPDANGEVLHSFDGTTFTPFPGLYEPWAFTVFGDALYFWASDEPEGDSRLWRIAPAAAVQPAAPTLPPTGSDAVGWSAGAALLLLLGTALLSPARRRASDTVSSSGLE